MLASYSSSSSPLDSCASSSVARFAAPCNPPASPPAESGLQRFDAGSGRGQRQRGRGDLIQVWTGRAKPVCLQPRPGLCQASGTYGSAGADGSSVRPYTQVCARSTWRPNLPLPIPCPAWVRILNLQQQGLYGPRCGEAHDRLGLDRASGELAGNQRIECSPVQVRFRQHLMPGYFQLVLAPELLVQDGQDVLLHARQL